MQRGDCPWHCVANLPSVSSLFKPIVPAFSRFLDVMELLLSPESSNACDRVFVPRDALASLVFHDWRRINLTLLWEIVKRKIMTIETFLTVHGSKKDEEELSRRFRDELSSFGMVSAKRSTIEHGDNVEGGREKTSDNLDVFNEIVSEVVTLALADGVSSCL